MIHHPSCPARVPFTPAVACICPPPTMWDVTMTEHRPDDWSPKTRAAVRLVLVAFLAVVATLAVVSVVHPTPWSPLGQAEEPAPASVEAPAGEVRGA